jgi:hypothetical protein
MNRSAKFALILTSLAIAVPQGAAAAVPNAKLWNGTWQLNPAASKFVSSGKRESETRTYAISGNKVTMKSTSKTASGKTLNVSYSARTDGKYYPMTGNPNADRIALSLVSDRELKWSSQLHGKTTIAGTAAVTADGKHLTLKRTMLTVKGTPTDVLKFDR